MTRKSENPYNDFGKLLMSALLEVKKSQADVARATKVNKKSISFACFKLHRITQEDVVKIVGYLKTQGAKPNLDEFLATYNLISDDIKEMLLKAILKDPKINPRKIRRLLINLIK